MLGGYAALVLDRLRWEADLFADSPCEADAVVEGEDTGIGMDEETADLALEPLRQASGG